MSEDAPARRTAPRRRGAASGRRVAGLGAVLGAVLVLQPTTVAHADLIRDGQWALRELRAEQAWRTTRGAGVTVAVLDTGVDADHRDLAGNVLTGKDLVGFGAGPGDEAWAGHGTAMAGIIAGHGHGWNHGDGVMGLAPEARIMPVRVILEEDDPQLAKARRTRANALAEGIRWAVDHGADVINLSLGDDSKSAHPEPEQDEAVQYALAKGVVVVASAGNGGASGNRVSYPAAYPGVIAVTAVDRDGRRADFSTRRWYATVSAPGVDVVTADPDGQYYEGWGTSAAAAWVSGTAALLKSEHPELTPSEVKRLIEETAEDPPKGGRDDSRGHGLVNPVAALEAAEKSGPDERRVAAQYADRYFGDGPGEAAGEPDAPGWAFPAAAVGAGLVLGAAVLARPRLRRR
ncbi:type VII secretion-associated serine protease mycosin [Streptomyces fragilis]|uniref:type VII secretion-associated serine protease mycosin n=1 Tax=Streptomyces fragilis TaxID=67301 RepID=UPI000D5946D4